MHTDPHPLSNKRVKLNLGISPANDELRDQPYLIEDYWDRVGTRSWMDETGNPACLKFAMRSAFAGLPLDQEVVYGKIDGFGHLVHVSELGDVVDDPQ